MGLFLVMILVFALMQETDGQSGDECEGGNTVINMRFRDPYHELQPTGCSNCGPLDELCACDVPPFNVPPPVPPSNLRSTFCKVFPAGTLETCN